MDNEDDSLPYIDDTTDDDKNNQYNLKIIENYQNKNRNIEITSLNDVINKSVGSAAPLADEEELTDSQSENTIKQPDTFTTSGMKLVIKSWNSSVSIQGLDNKSSITFRRKSEKALKSMGKCVERKGKSEDEGKSSEKPKKGRWKVLTKSLMLTKSGRLERRGLDERYPKYVLLKNEEEESPKIKESYPKIFAFENKSDLKGNENIPNKSEFSFKKSFKNKTKPIVPMEVILKKNDPRTESGVLKRQKKMLNERRAAVKKIEDNNTPSVEELTTQVDNTQEDIGKCPQRHVFREIQGIIEDTLKLAPPSVECVQQEPHYPQGKPMDYCTSHQFCQYPCHDPYCSMGHTHLSSCMPANAQPKQAYSNINTGPPCYIHTPRETDVEPYQAEVDIQNLQFGVLSSFFPKVFILKAIQTQNLAEEEVETTKRNDLDPLSQNEEVKTQEYGKPLESLEVPQQDLTLKSKMVQEIAVTDPEEDFYLEDLSKREDQGSDEDQKTKTDESETTEYLHYCEFDPADNDSAERTQIPAASPSNRCREDKNPSTADKIDDECSKNYSLTKIGYKMYDNLTKLSLNREKETVEKEEVSGCGGSDGNKAKKSPYNITLESNNNVVKVTVPENELSFQIVNSEGADILIGVSGGENKNKMKEEEEKKIVRRDELWHADDGKRAVIVRQSQQDEGDKTAGSQKLRVSLADNKEVLLSIEMKEKNKNEDKIKPKSTKETKVGTDDFDLAGGDFICTLGESHKNLSPRTAQLLKSLQDKLKIGEQERKFLEEKISQKITDQKYENKILPGLFLMKQINRTPQFYKEPLKIPPVRKPKKETDKGPAGQLREYYCEDCLATMRIFEDSNPSVKSMVDKFETIIQLKSS